MKITIFIKLRIHFSLYKILQRDQKTTTATINQSINQALVPKFWDWLRFLNNQQSHYQMYLGDASTANVYL